MKPNQTKSNQIKPRGGGDGQIITFFCRAARANFSHLIWFAEEFRLSYEGERRFS
jgi:hypothetical protein